MSDKLKQIGTVFLAILAAVGAFFLLRKNDAPAKVQELETQVKTNDTLVKAEETKREEIVKTGEQEKAKDVTGQELADSLTDLLNKPK